MVLFQGRSSFRYVKSFLGMAAKRLAGMSGVEIYRTSHVQVDDHGDSRVYAQIDGEFAGHLPADVRIVPDALTLLMPPAFCQRWESDARAYRSA